ncbi:MAG: ligase-associated DNA damage response endonuclease PdeM [Bacteroidota bacterium]
MQQVNIQGEKLQLHPEKAIFWPNPSILFMADLHLGKGAHFRKAGIAVPLAVEDANFTRLRQLITDCNPRRIIMLGDIFHSHYNHVWDIFEQFIFSYPNISFELVPGNHDILPASAYRDAPLVIHSEHYELPPFYLTHYPAEDPTTIPAHLYQLAGHLHPAVRLQDRLHTHGIRLPCFYFGERQGILPAFGEFTGCAEVKVKKGDRVFVLADREVIAV